MSTADVRVFELVSEVLAENLGQTESQSYLAQIRERYYSKHLPNLPFKIIDSAIGSCRTCDEAEATPISGWWNWQDCDFLIVSHNAHADSHYVKKLGTLLKSAGFSSAFCGVVHVTKCKFAKIQKNNVDNCSRYVFDQIDLSRPKAIGILGSSAFELFNNGYTNYTSSIGSSWWWGVYKIFSLPSSNNFEDERWLPILTKVHEHIYGSITETINIP